MEVLNKNILLPGELIADRWKIGEKIGEGTFSQIYSAYSIEDGGRVAVKVEAPSSLKPVLEWESVILKSLQDCPHVCRYYYHGKHAESTVLVMELLGESMSMLRMSPDAAHGVPFSRCVSVGLEMLDCIEAFHRHGYVHRDIKASNFAMNRADKLQRQRYYIIDFGLSRQHLDENKKVIPARPLAEFRGTSMYASLSSHRRQELGPKDDLWSWFYLVMDFMRGELPWASDAQLKNRSTVLSLKEYYTETSPNLLVEGLQGATYLLDLMKYLQSLKYEDLPDYKRIGLILKSVLSESPEDDEKEGSPQEPEELNVAGFEVGWEELETDRERALVWVKKAAEALNGAATQAVLDGLLEMAAKYDTFFACDGLESLEWLDVQESVLKLEQKKRVGSNLLLPPPIQSFVKRRMSEQKLRTDALQRRRERDLQVRRTLEKQNVVRAGNTLAQRGNLIPSGSDTPRQPTPEETVNDGGARSDSSMEMSDGEESNAPTTGSRSQGASKRLSIPSDGHGGSDEQRVDTRSQAPVPPNARARRQMVSPRPPIPTTGQGVSPRLTLPPTGQVASPRPPIPSAGQRVGVPPPPPPPPRQLQHMRGVPPPLPPPPARFSNSPMSNPPVPPPHPTPSSRGRTNSSELLRYDQDGRSKYAVTPRQGQDSRPRSPPYHHNGDANGRETATNHYHEVIQDDRDYAPRRRSHDYEERGYRSSRSEKVGGEVVAVAVRRYDSRDEREYSRERRHEGYLNERREYDDRRQSPAQHEYSSQRSEERRRPYDAAYERHSSSHHSESTVKAYQRVYRQEQKRSRSRSTDRGRKLRRQRRSYSSSPSRSPSRSLSRSPSRSRSRSRSLTPRPRSRSTSRSPSRSPVYRKSASSYHRRSRERTKSSRSRSTHRRSGRSHSRSRSSSRSRSPSRSPSPQRRRSHSSQQHRSHSYEEEYEHQETRSNRYDDGSWHKSHDHRNSYERRQASPGRSPPTSSSHRVSRWQPRS